MRGAALLAALLCVGALAMAAGCSSSDSDLGTGSSSGSSSGGDSGTDADAAVADPNGGRDNLAASCFASCQNVGFSCVPHGGSNTDIATVQVAGVSGGCAGNSLTGEAKSSISIDCLTSTVCTGADGATPTACVPGLFSAFTFSFTPAGGVQTICTRN